MKKIALIIILIILAICVTSSMVSCANAIKNTDNVHSNDSISPAISDRFVIIYESDLNIESYIVYDKETKVEYVVSDGVYNRGLMTMLVDSLGKPKIYKK